MIANSIVQRLRLGFTWCYLLKCPNGYLLIDTSYPDYFPQFQKSTAKLGIDISGIKYLLLTHHHDVMTMQGLRLNWSRRQDVGSLLITMP